MLARLSRTHLSLAAVLTSTVGVGLAYGMGYTLTSLRFEEWGQPGWMVGLAAALPALAVVGAIPYAPRLATRLGTVQTMLLGTALAGLSFALMPVLASPGWWLALRVLAGASLALPWLAGETWMNTVMADRIRGRVLALYVILLFGGWAAGPQIVDALGTTTLAPYLIGVVAMALSALPLVLGRRLAPPIHGTGRFALGAIARLAPLAFAAAFVGGVTEFGYLSLLPSYAIEAGVPESTALGLLTVLLLGSVSLQLAIGWLADRVDRVRLLTAMALTLALVAIVVALVLDRGAWAIPATFVLGGVVTGFYGVGLAVLGQQVAPGQLVLANAAFLMAYEGGAVVGPLIGGAALDLWPPHGIAVVIVAVALGYAAVLTRPRQPAVAPMPSRRPSA